jgi:hypothetical protein
MNSVTVICVQPRDPFSKKKKKKSQLGGKKIEYNPKYHLEH